VPASTENLVETCRQLESSTSGSVQNVQCAGQPHCVASETRANDQGSRTNVPNHLDNSEREQAGKQGAMRECEGKNKMIRKRKEHAHTERVKARERERVTPTSFIRVHSDMNAFLRRVPLNCIATVAALELQPFPNHAPKPRSQPKICHTDVLPRDRLIVTAVQFVHVWGAGFQPGQVPV
jgi:hypothetical protein